ncbi:unnamed protein product [Rotaria magnacalcarata]|uniref:Uncharacterized protein n=2 Tax=Rotaria magnacalcarata TaxID=392030 RepID=A0A819EQ57_9BILA|nr:unnamed protein product [Rotaria magnacalcarata]CAF1583466.1 unnamed protein product [Rotaria magnacalcarata]CAF2090490.1 unnamed protein product [Rotaria magnacalcarata]CAF2143369.1 unnamed protein product [Rotaria magnacalcarata]CAF3791820.1 unnamed protein product [Rotaria magnacalcarata]
MVSNEDDEIKMDGISKALPIDNDKENKRRHHHQHQHYPHHHHHHDGSASSAENILTNKEPILTKQLRAIVKQAQDTVDYDQEKFVNDIRTNLFQRQQILNELQTRLQAFADCLQQEEQVAAAQRVKKQQSNDIMN